MASPPLKSVFTVTVVRECVNESQAERSTGEPFYRLKRYFGTLFATDYAFQHAYKCLVNQFLCMAVKRLLEENCVLGRHFQKNVLHDCRSFLICR